MPICEQFHRIVDSRKKVVYLPHEYVAGLCLEAHSLSTQSFLLAHYPYYHSQDYERSKEMCFNPQTAPVAPQVVEAYAEPKKAPRSPSQARRERRKRAEARRRTELALAIIAVS